MQIIAKKVEYAGAEEIHTLEELEFEIKGLENAIAQAQELKTRLEQTLLLTKMQMGDSLSDGQISKD